jgi:hypothetical protein
VLELKGLSRRYGDLIALDDSGGGDVGGQH